MLSSPVHKLGSVLIRAYKQHFGFSIEVNNRILDSGTCRR
jgi:hypothetical protein